MASDRSANATTFLYFGIVTALGLSAAMLGPSLPTLEAQTGSSTEAIAWLFTARAGGVVLGSLLLGRFYERVPGNRILALALACSAPTLASIPFIDSLSGVVAAMLLVGACEGTIHVGTNTLLVRLHGANAAPYLNGLHFSFGVGATIAPAALGLSFDLGGGILPPFASVAVLMLLILPFLLRLPTPDVRDNSERTHETGAVPTLLLLLFPLMFLLYVGAESSVSGWVYSYAVELNLADKASAAWLTSLFWGGLTLGRLAGVPASRRFAPRHILLTDLIGGLAGLLFMGLLGNSFTSLAIGTAFYGFMIGSIFATLMAFAATRIKLTGAITGFFFVGAALGGMSVPWIVGQFFGSLGPGTMILASGIALVTGCVVLAIILRITRA